MRISTPYQYGSLTMNIAETQRRMVEAQQQVSTGIRLNKPSDDPSGTLRTLSMRSLRNGISQYEKNLMTAKGTLGFSEIALDEANQLMNRAYELAVRGASSTSSTSDRAAMAAEITEIQDRLVEVANSRGPTGQYLFAGQITDTKPFDVGAGVLNYNGDNSNIVIEVGPTETLAVNTPGDPLFGDLYSRLESLKTNLLAGDVSQLSAINIDDMQKSLETINNFRGVIGAKLRTVEHLESQFSRRSDELTESISDVEEVDLSQAVMDYQLAQTAYQAALSVASQGFGLSLMDFIRG